MKRQLIAFLALLSGLAALSGPANASVISAVSCDVGISAEANESKAGTPESVREAAKKRPVRCRTVKTPKRVQLPQSLRVPVAMGIERAYE